MKIIYNICLERNKCNLNQLKTMLKFNKTNIYICIKNQKYTNNALLKLKINDIFWEIIYNWLQIRENLCI